MSQQNSSPSRTFRNWHIHVVVLGLTYYGLYAMCASSLPDKGVAAVYAGGLMMFAGPAIFLVTAAILWIVRRR